MLDAYVGSPVMIYLLTECFQNLRHAKALEQVGHWWDDSFGYISTLTALHLAGISRKVADVTV